jgi:broad specificity phosphatase PhoE
MRKHLFYFVRHGESILNSKGIRQGADGSLSDKGKAQADITGQRLKNRKIEVLLVSPYTRTKETAAEINKYLDKPIEYNDLLKERRNPSEIVGRSVSDPVVMHIVDQIDKSYHLDNYRFSDEENFEDLRDRAKALLAHLETRKEKTVLVVTHGIFLKMFIAYMLYGDKLTASGYNKLSFFNASNNAAITVCQYVDGWFAPPKEKRWTLLGWDDYAR